MVEQVRQLKGAVGSRVEEMIDVVRSPQWATDITLQLGTVTTLRLGIDGGKPIPQEVWNRLNAECRLAFARIPHQTAHRWDRLLVLTNDEDVIRALKWEPRNSVRYLGEEVYPTDGWIGTYLRWVQEGEVPLGFHFWSAVAAIGASCHRNVFMDRGSFYLYPAHSVLFVGPPGVRKTQAVSTAMGVIGVVNRQLSREWANQLRNRPAELYTTDPRINILPNDASFLSILKQLQGNTGVTVEGDPLVLTMDQDSCGIMGLDELGTLLSKDGFAVGKTIDTLIALCDAPQQYRYHTEKQGDLTLNNVALSFLAATTPHWMRENLTTRMFLGGFSSRILFVYRLDSGGRVYPAPAPLDPVAREDLAGWLARLCRRGKTPMELTPDATARFNQWYVENHAIVDGRDLDERLGGYYRRKDGHLLRLAMVLALSYDEAPWVTRERLEQALVLLNFEEVTMLECFGEVGRHPDAPTLNILLGVLRKHQGELVYSDWMRKCHHYEGVGKRFPELVATLVAMNKVVQVVPTGKVRANSAKVYRVVAESEDGMPQSLPVTPVDLGV